MDIPEPPKSQFWITLLILVGVFIALTQFSSKRGSERVVGNMQHNQAEAPEASSAESSSSDSLKNRNAMLAQIVPQDELADSPGGKLVKEKGDIDLTLLDAMLKEIDEKYKSAGKTNFLQSSKTKLFAGNVLAGVIASVLVIFGQGAVDQIIELTRVNQEFVTSREFIVCVSLILFCLAGMGWMIWDASKSDSGQSTRSVIFFALSICMLIILLIGVIVALALYQSLEQSMG